MGSVPIERNESAKSMSATSARRRRKRELSATSTQTLDPMSAEVGKRKDLASGKKRSQRKRLVQARRAVPSPKSEQLQTRRKAHQAKKAEGTPRAETKVLAKL